MTVQDESGHLVGVIRDDLLGQECRQRHLGEDPARGGTLGVGMRSAARELVAGPWR
ncbi:Uncharacterised protein [Mycobacteroides abscessus subsp. abscessus]|nr:Uncharacterised protein [Mycobacteroides abscessus subsp. abscessus]